MKRVVIIDYGIGNLLSVSRALESCGADITFSSKVDEIVNADRLVLPGVGAFEHGMNSLRELNLVEAIQVFAEKNRPFMGICLGMQMMLEASSEFGQHQGLGLIPGSVNSIPRQGLDGASHKIPHIGWNGLQQTTGGDWSDSILKGIDPGSHVYFVHSFTAVPDDAEHRLADAYYGGQIISAAIRKGNLFGCQFHPEKSGHIGLKIVQNFLSHSTLS